MNKISNLRERTQENITSSKASTLLPRMFLQSVTSAVIALTGGCTTGSNLYSCGAELACADVRETKKYKLVEVEKDSIQNNSSPAKEAMEQIINNDEYIDSITLLEKNQENIIIEVKLKKSTTFTWQQSLGNNFKKGTHTGIGFRFTFIPTGKKEEGIGSIFVDNKEVAKLKIRV